MFLQARVLFDNYNPENEDMAWALTDDQKLQVAKSIRWEVDDESVAKVSILEGDASNTRAVITAVGRGKATVTVKLETKDNVWKSATATIYVTEYASDVEYNQGDALFYEKHTYDLKEYTNLIYKNDKLSATAPEAEKVTFSDLKLTGAKGTLSDDGILQVKKADSSSTATCTITTENGITKSATIKFGDANPVTKIEIKTPSDKKMALDYGKQGKETGTIEIKLIAKDSSKPTTDDIEWTSKKVSIADVETKSMLYGKRTDKDESVKNTIIATGDAVGKTTITAKTTSGKKATVSVTVAATPDNVTIYAFDGSEDKGYSTYSGKKTTMKAVLTAKDKPLPVGTTKLKWSIEKVDNKADKNAKVSGKKDIATITPANLLTDPDNGVTVKVKVVATWKDNGSTETKEDTYTLALKQSDVSDIEILSKDITGDAEKAIVGKLPTKKNAKAGNIYIGNDYNCNVNAYNSAKALDNALAETIGWTVSGKSAEINENGILKPIKAGKTTVTASYVTLDKSKPNKTKAKLNKKTFTVSVIQNASEIALNKTEFVVSGLKATGKKNITISAKAVAPNKKATFTIPNDGWKI